MLIPFSELVRKYNIHPNGVIHIGAHWGEEASDYINMGITKSIWVEANYDCMDILYTNTSKFSEILILNECISDVDDIEIILNISNNEGQSSSILDLSYHKIAHPEVNYINSKQVKTSRIDTLLRKYNRDIENYPFVNIDIQGAELLALKSFGKLLYKVKYLYLEVNEKELYKDCSLIGDIENYIKEFGFERVEKVMAGNFGWGDAFYINRNL